MMLDVKKYIHDCKNCIFLGTDIDTKMSREVDMYYCHQRGLPTIIMRYGDNGEDYQSAPINVILTTDVFDESPILRNMLIAEDKKLWYREDMYIIKDKSCE